MNSRNRGFIKTIILIIIALVILKYVFHIDLKDIFSSTVFQDIWSIIKTLFKLLWQTLAIIIEFLKQIVSSAKDFVDGLNK